MENKNLHILNTFDIHSLPNLDVVVLGALERFKEETLPEFDPKKISRKPLVVGSANAYTVGEILFRNSFARVIEEGEFDSALEKFTDRDSIVIISASGAKHAVTIAQKLYEHKIDQSLPVWLLTNNGKAPAKEFIDREQVLLFPKNREPYTYNTSTYLSMILSQTKESPEKIYTHLESVRKKLPTNLGRYDAFVFTVPSAFEEVRGMFRTKFDELFGGHVIGRIFTEEEIKHAKTVVPSDKELTVHLVSGDSTENSIVDKKRAHIEVPLSKDSSYGEVLALGYFIIGKIQEAHPAYFKENIVAYTKDASEIFNQTINPIVE